MLLLKNGTLIDWQTLEFREADILVEEVCKEEFISPLLQESLPARQAGGRG